MSKKTTVISALTFLVAQVGFTPATLAKTQSVAQQCQELLDTGNRAILQEQLELLLDQDPNHECIPMIVGLLGGAPLALAEEEDDHTEPGERGQGESDPGVTVSAY